MISHVLLAAHSILAPSDPQLQQRSAEVSLEELKLPETQDVIDEMLSIASGEREDLDSGVMVGLAAPQIGVLKRIVLVDVGFNPESKELGALQVFINPSIVSRSSEETEDHEGCYSVDSHVCGVVSRADRVAVRAYDRLGNESVSEYCGFTARIFQHEIDHLEGIRFPDRIADPRQLHWVEPDQYAQYRAEWRDWKTCYSPEDWQRAKGL